MTPKARRRREIVYCIEQGIMLCMMLGGFCGVLILFRTVLRMAGCE